MNGSDTAVSLAIKTLAEAAGVQCEVKPAEPYYETDPPQSDCPIFGDNPAAADWTGDPWERLIVEANAQMECFGDSFQLDTRLDASAPTPRPQCEMKAIASVVLGNAGSVSKLFAPFYYSAGQFTSLCECAKYDGTNRWLMVTYLNEPIPVANNGDALYALLAGLPHDCPVMLPEYRDGCLSSQIVGVYRWLDSFPNAKQLVDAAFGLFMSHDRLWELNRDKRLRRSMVHDLSAFLKARELYQLREHDDSIPF